MDNFPRLLHISYEQRLSQQLFLDLQMDKIFSSSAIQVLCHPCAKQEILDRSELFQALEHPEALEKTNQCLTKLKNCLHLLSLLDMSQTEFERYRLRISSAKAYISACEALSTLNIDTNITKRLSAYFGKGFFRDRICQMAQDMEEAQALFDDFNRGSLSFSNKCWLTPDYADCDVFDEIAKSARSLGLSVGGKKKCNVLVDESLSSSILQLYHEHVSRLDAILDKYAMLDFLEPTRLIPEFAFYIELITLVNKAFDIGVPHCYPQISDKLEYCAKEVYDITLLAKNVTDIVANDVNVSIADPFFFLLGANGGGKTTYLRAVGLNLILFMSGCPIFAKSATIYPFELVVSHFSSDERFDGIGRLDEELLRINELRQMTCSKTAFWLLNETFSGTDETKGALLLQENARNIRDSGQFGLCVTHFHSVSNIGYPVLFAAVDATNTNKRTYHIQRSKGDANSYAVDILKKYRLDRESLEERRKARGI